MVTEGLPELTQIKAPPPRPQNAIAFWRGQWFSKTELLPLLAAQADRQMTKFMTIDGNAAKTRACLISSQAAKALYERIGATKAEELRRKPMADFDQVLDDERERIQPGWETVSGDEETEKSLGSQAMGMKLLEDLAGDDDDVDNRFESPVMSEAIGE